MSLQSLPHFTINTLRLHQLIEQLSHIGKQEGKTGLYRPAFSPADDQARRWFSEVCQAAGIDVYEDAACNMIARIGPKDKSAIATGSHLDTVAGGGHLDGAYVSLQVWKRYFLLRNKIFL